MDEALFREHAEDFLQVVSTKFVGLGEQADDLQPFDARLFAEALFSEKE